MRRTLYELRVVEGLMKDHMQFGSCDSWMQKNPCLRIDKSLKGRMLLDTLIHELSHAWFDDLIKEEAIDQYATDMARLLCKLFPHLTELELQ